MSYGVLLKDANDEITLNENLRLPYLVKEVNVFADHYDITTLTQDVVSNISFSVYTDLPDNYLSGELQEYFYEYYQSEVFDVTFVDYLGRTNRDVYYQINVGSHTSNVSYTNSIVSTQIKHDISFDMVVDSELKSFLDTGDYTFEFNINIYRG